MFHPIWPGGASEAGYLRIIVVAAAIGITSGASTTSTLLEGSPEGSFRNMGRSDNDAWLYLTSPSTEPESIVNAPLTNSAPIPIQSRPSAALPENQKSNNVLEKQPEPQVPAVGLTNSEQHCKLRCVNNSTSHFGCRTARINLIRDRVDTVRDEVKLNAVSAPQ
jgi:hypothetical protein